jgi:hypothetical protein
VGQKMQLGPPPGAGAGPGDDAGTGGSAAGAGGGMALPGNAGRLDPSAAATPLGASASGIDPPKATAGAGRGDPIISAWQASKAQFTKVQSALGQLGQLRETLDGLLQMGDTVTPDDVIKASSTLVSKGFSAHEMAVLLTDMPPGGEAMQQWLQAHDSWVQQMEAQSVQVEAAARHQMGVDALHVLMQDHMQGAQLRRAPSAGSA